MVLPICAFASPGGALISAPLPDRFFISFCSLLYVCWLSENAALYLDCWTLFRSFQKVNAEAPRLNNKGRSGESSRCAWSRRESRHGVRGVAERVVGRVVTVCVEWPRESSGESSRCAWSGRESRRESRQGGRESRRESRQGVRGVVERVVGRVVKVSVEWTAESSRSGRESRPSGQMYGSASSRSRDRTQADGAVSHLELERSCGSIPAGLRGGCPISVDPVEFGSPRRVGWVTAGNGQRRAKFGGRRTRSPPEQKLLRASPLVSPAGENGRKCDFFCRGI